MKAEGHLAKAKEIQESIGILRKDSVDKHVVSITEMCYGVAQHLISSLMEWRRNTADI